MHVSTIVRRNMVDSGGFTDEHAEPRSRKRLSSKITDSPPPSLFHERLSGTVDVHLTQRSCDQAEEEPSSGRSSQWSCGSSTLEPQDLAKRLTDALFEESSNTSACEGTPAKRRRSDGEQLALTVRSEMSAFMLSAFRPRRGKVGGVLDLGGLGLGDDVAQDVALALPFLLRKGLQRLNLQSNSITDFGAAALAQAVLALDVQCPLRRLNLRGNAIGLEGAARLSEALLRMPHLESVDCGANAWGVHGAALLGEAAVHLSQEVPHVLSVVL